MLRPWREAEKAGDHFAPDHLGVCVSAAEQHSVRESCLLTSPQGNRRRLGQGGASGWRCYFVGETREEAAQIIWRLQSVV